MNDHQSLVSIWHKVRKSHVMVFLDHENYLEYSEMILDWFEPITKLRLNDTEILLNNNKLLVIRRLGNNRALGLVSTDSSYQVIALSSSILEEIKESLHGR